MRGFTSCTLAALLLAVALAKPHGHGHGHSHNHDHDHHHHHHNHDHDHSHDHHDHSHDHGHDHNHDHGHHHACHKLAPHNADFGFAIYKNLNGKTEAGKNIFFSPLGISSALTMLAKGARGETYTQLVSALGYSSLTPDQIDEAYSHLFSMIQSNEENQALSLGNAVAVRQGFSPLQTYQNAVERFFSGKLFDVNFAEPASAAEEINNFIANKTRNMIQDQVKDLDPETAMVLINYIYFMGEWEKPFDALQTAKEDFQVDENTKVQVDMMKRTGRYDFYHDFDNNTRVIMLPYKGNTSMMIVLPDEGKMSELEAKLDKRDLRSWRQQLSRASVDLFLPKFSINAEASLDNTLNEMGVTAAYGDTADFTGISAEPRLKVSKVSHRAALSVDETGTTAAASTTIEIMPMSMPEVMKLNRPFMVFILESSTRSILFMGKVANPTAV